MLGVWNRLYFYLGLSYHGSSLPQNGDSGRYRRLIDTNDCKNTWQIIVPKPLRKNILDVAHGAIDSGHLGINKTVDKIRDKYYWVGFKQDVARWVGACDLCHPNLTAW